MVVLSMVSTPYDEALSLIRNQEDRMAAGTYDYTKPGSYPRSGRDMVGGIVFLGRTIDKTRAHIAGTAGEYVALRGLSARVFELFGVTPEQFEQAVRENDTDEGVLRALESVGKKPSQQEIEAHNKT